MMRSSMLVIFALVAVATATDAGASVTPIQKVLQMMEELKAKAQEEKQAEIDTFNEFTTFCKNTIREKGFAIKSASESIEQLKATIEKNEADAMVLGAAAETLGKSVDQTTHEKALANEVREKEKADFTGTHTDYLEQIEDLELGAAKLKKMMKSTDASASSLLQMSVRPRLSEKSRNLLLSFLATSSSEKRQPAEPAFESQSSGVTDMMEDLKDKIAGEKTALEDEETQRQHAHDMSMQMLDQQIKKDSEERTEKVSQRKAREGVVAQAKGELPDTVATKEEDEKYVAELTTNCEQKSQDFELRQQTRAEELVAIDKAMEIIADPSVSGAGNKHLPQLVQRRGVVLGQLRNTLDLAQRTIVQKAAASFLNMRSRQYDSGILSALAIRVSSDPFVKVRKMIQDMIQKLNDEASDEAEHKGFCDEEMANNKATRDEKSTSVEELTANIEELSGTVAQLAKEITTLTAEVAEIGAAVKEATKIRGEEKAKNTVTIADSKAAIVGVSKAIEVLKDFYEKAAASLLQVSSSSSSSGGAGGIMGMLDVILSDFQRLESETTAMETANKKEYETFMSESTENKDVKSKAIVDKTRLRTKTEHEIKLTKKEMKAEQAELKAADEYYEKLKPSCVDAGVSYEDRVKQREEEIESLKEALKILEDEA